MKNVWYKNIPTQQFSTSSHQLMLTSEEQKALAINEAIKVAGPPTGYPQQVVNGFTLKIWQTEDGPAWYCVEAKEMLGEQGR